MMKQSTRHAVSADAEGQVRPDGLPRGAEEHNIFSFFCIQTTHISQKIRNFAENILLWERRKPAAAGCEK